MRQVVALALRSHIPVQTWLDGHPRDLDTALELLTEEDRGDPVATLRLRMEITGAREVIRACRRLPADAQNELRDGSYELAQDLARIVKASGLSDSRQSARAARTVKARRDRFPVIEAGGTKRASAVLFGSEYGIKRRTGWYANPRYGESPERQFRPWHQGSYWFHRTVTDEAARIRRHHEFMAGEIIARFARATDG